MKRFGNLEFPSDSRCYNGCWDDVSQAVINNQEKALNFIRKQFPRVHVTYFPMEEVWQVHEMGNPLSDFKATKGLAIQDALRRIE